MEGQNSGGSISFVTKKLEKWTITYSTQIWDPEGTMSEQWTKVHLSHNDAKCKSQLTPWEVKGKEASIEVHADDNV